MGLLPACLLNGYQLTPCPLIRGWERSVWMDATSLQHQLLCRKFIWWRAASERETETAEMKGHRKGCPTLGSSILSQVPRASAIWRVLILEQVWYGGESTPALMGSGKGIQEHVVVSGGIKELPPSHTGNGTRIVVMQGCVQTAGQGCPANSHHPASHIAPYSGAQDPLPPGGAVWSSVEAEKHSLVEESVLRSRVPV